MKLLFDRQIYQRFTESHLTQARRFVWIATANIKATGVLYRNRFMAFPDLMAALVSRGVSIRIIHAELPSRPFRARYEQLDAKGRLSAGVEFLQCIRMHAKVFIVDGSVALVGSPNLTGAGIGAKGENKRNFEVAFLMEGQEEAAPFIEYFDNLWMGGPCPQCGHRAICPAPANSPDL